jgi:sugar/nucleoside kinase (ribokinase family)
MSTADVPEETRAAVEVCRRELPAEFPGGDLVFGFDGVVDTVRIAVDERHDADSFDRLSTLKALRDRLDEAIAAESSLLLKWQREGQRTGGHACHLSRVFNRLGADTTMVGTYGRPPQEPFETEFADSKIYSIGTPGYCDAVEFDDGKLMLTETSDAAGLNWERLQDRIDPETLAEHIDGADVLGVGYWTVTTALPELVANTVEETWDLQESPPERVFFDPGDVHNLSEETVREGASKLARTTETVPVTVSANRSETEGLVSVLDGSVANSLYENAERALEGLGVDRFVAHSPSLSVTATATETVGVGVPNVENPAMTTSAGDHFNAGYILGHLAGLSLEATTVVANALAVEFVRTGDPPNYESVQSAVDSYLNWFDSAG